MAKAGSPEWIVTKEILKEIEKLAGIGLTSKQIADYYGINKKTIERKMKDETTGISVAIKKGRSRGGGAVATSLYNKAVGGNVVAMIFYLKCRLQWRELDQDIEREGNPLKLSYSKEELAKEDK